MAGRLVLVKSVAEAIPSYVMQVILLPKQLLTIMDIKIMDFLWGFKEDQSHYLYLKSWDSMCVPKVFKGLGIQKMVDINLASITKLA